ncbi:prolyl oligopeptidase family serine peptidase [Roseimicrobium sp. ORNL1]|uniref:prolyl oligopeptidase family serine peptidase n=1 Tax=Roseimicrobium sp. ORNL1 TaxID=2711231 RepID=UPI0013E185CF|nr:prolyl oligopeptidase family serine peptidase [Roseimicrobium sp. ORNL1]QIF01677.1 prolyl oligopeptidase family serine peptidase [Roseimicrobium sp. ORNL1]
MKPLFPVILALLLGSAGASVSHAQLRADGATASFRGSLPPKAVSPISGAPRATLERELDAQTRAFIAVKRHPRAADADIFLKAVRYALEFNEWYDKTPEDGVKKANALLAEAKSRIESLRKNETPWLQGSGTKVVGFYSRIDGSPQPYGVEVPEGVSLEGGAQIPMWVWLHGRGDTATDLSFVYGKLTAKKPGQFQPKGAIVIHPFGRYCNGYKSAGETDVLEARDDAKARFNVDPNRVVLAGFSMGGAGAWHLGAHFADQWACVHTGAGFVDVKRYQKLTPEKMPSWYEQTLWGVYDVPDYARNFFNVPLISYSGEKDSQRDSAEYMTEVLAKEEYTLKHLIGPGMEHKYEPGVQQEVQTLVEAEMNKGRDPLPRRVVLQYRSGRYAKMFWLEGLEVEKEWDDARIDAIVSQGGVLRVTTKNVRAFRVDPAIIREAVARPYTISINGQDIIFNEKAEIAPKNYYVTQDDQGRWSINTSPAKAAGTVKAGGTTIEDAFLDRFIVVLPEKDSYSPKVNAWVKAESQHFLSRWRSLMRGDAIVKRASEITPEDIQSSHLILWGDTRSNPLIAQLLPKTPVRWTADEVVVGTQKGDAETHVLVMGYPNPLAPHRRVVLNSGLTFREAHDRTNSLQNPKLPDWAIIDISTPADAERPGKVVAADFFDEKWQVRPAR